MVMLKSELGFPTSMERYHFEGVLGSGKGSLFS